MRILLVKSKNIIVDDDDSDDESTEIQAKS